MSTGKTPLSQIYPKSIPEHLGNTWELGDRGSDLLFWDSRNASLSLNIPPVGIEDKEQKTDI